MVGFCQPLPSPKRLGLGLCVDVHYDPYRAINDEHFCVSMLNVWSSYIIWFEMNNVACT